MTIVHANEDLELGAFTDAELRFLRKTVSMQQGSLEERHVHANERDKPRIERDIRTASTTYPKIQYAINARLLGEEEDVDE